MAGAKFPSQRWFGHPYFFFAVFFAAVFFAAGFFAAAFFVAIMSSPPFFTPHGKG